MTEDQTNLTSTRVEASTAVTPARSTKPKLQEVDAKVNKLILSMAEVRDTLTDQKEQLDGFKEELLEAMLSATKEEL